MNLLENQGICNDLRYNGGGGSEKLKKIALRNLWTPSLHRRAKLHKIKIKKKSLLESPQIIQFVVVF
jgi:hypothetical protein